jgi:hypothetical protein
MVRLLQPEAGMRIYDPCVGSGGMLILSRDYVQETGGDPQDIALYGQDANGSVPMGHSRVDPRRSLSGPSAYNGAHCYLVTCTDKRT